MESHHKLKDDTFEQQIIKCVFPPEDFTHEAHLRMAWINISKYGIKDAEKKVQEQLKKFVEHVGAKDKYNATLTIAGLKVVHHYMQGSKSNTFVDFINEYPQLKFNFKTLISAHYGIDIYHSEQAKARFLEPDLMPFD